MNILGIIPARGGSKKVPRKNIRVLAGKPLIAYAIEESFKSRFITRTIVTTDDEEIARTAKGFGADVPFLRPAELAEDHVTDLPVFRHCLDWLKENDSCVPDIVVHLRPTAPLRTCAHIDSAVGLLLENPQADSVRSVTDAGPHPLKMWRIEGDLLFPFIPEHIYGIKECYNMPRQKLPKAYIQNGSVDVLRARTILEKNSMSGDKIVPFVMDEMDSVNIDTEIDFQMAEEIIKKRKRELK
jgi:N-acylneuraminate cytidylyltransferase